MNIKKWPVSSVQITRGLSSSMGRRDRKKKEVFDVYNLLFSLDYGQEKLNQYPATHRED